MNRAYTDEENQYILSNLDLPVAVISEHLNRPRTSLYAHIDWLESGILAKRVQELISGLVEIDNLAWRVQDLLAGLVKKSEGVKA